MLAELDQSSPTLDQLSGPQRETIHKYYWQLAKSQEENYQRERLDQLAEEQGMFFTSTINVLHHLPLMSVQDVVGNPAFSADAVEEVPVYPSVVFAPNELPRTEQESIPFPSLEH